jgi:sugar lactone lactonase YvrE
MLGGVYSVNKTTGEKTLLVGSKSLSAAVTEIEERDGYLYFLDNQSGVVWRYDPKTEKTERFIGNGRNELAVIGADRLDTGLYYPAGFTTDGNGNFYISEQHHILKINKEGKVELFAGAGGRDKYGYRDGPADAALFQAIRGISFDDKTHSLYVADTYNNRIRKIKDGKVTTVAGNGMQNEPVFGIYATESPLNRPHDIIVKESDIYISDSWNNTIVRIDENGILYAVAGIPVYKVYQGEGSYSGDGGDAQKARLNTPLNMEYYDGILYVVDAFNNRIRRVDNGKIDTIIGSNKKGYDSKDSMVLNFPSAVYVNDKYIYVADTGNFLVRRYKKEYIEKLKEER